MNGSFKDIINYRFERAQETLEEAELMFQSGHLNGAANRLYYACFYAVSGLLISKNLSSSKHSGVMAIFNKNFIKNKIIPVEYGKFYSRMFDMRTEGDYADMITHPEVEEHDIKTARDFIELLKEKNR